MKKISLLTLLLIPMLILTGCMSREEAAKYVTITMVQSPEAQINDWHPMSGKEHINPSTLQQNAIRFESPLGSIEINQEPTQLKTILEPQTFSAFNILKQHIEKQFSENHDDLINPAEDDSLQIAGIDFLHSTYRTRKSDKQRQRIELYIAPIQEHLMTIIVRIGDDADMQSYSALQTFLSLQVYRYNQH
jgi:hypothetical protein